MERYEEDFEFSQMIKNNQKRFLATSCYANAGDDYRRVSISGDKGKEANFDGKSYPDLAPKKEFWKIWHDNIGKISEEDNLWYYIEEYYKQVLSKIDLKQIENYLFGYGNDRILLCYEEPTEFCHRHIVASWIKLLYGIEIPEVKLTEVKYSPSHNYVANKFVPVDRYPLGKIIEILEIAMKENIANMR